MAWRKAPLAENTGNDRALEASWVERARAGDTAAFRLLVDAHRHVAYGVALRVLRRPEEAEDAVQEAFVRAWNAMPGFRGDAKFSTWLYRIVMRRSFDRLEMLKRRERRETAVEDAEVLAGSPGPEPGALGTSQLLETLVAKLPDAQRAAITMFYFQERSVNEVAQTLRMPVNTVKTHLSRARAALRDGWVRATEEDA